MSGAITDPPVGTPTYWLGICDTCQWVKSFATQRERDLWERHHPHENGDGA